MFPRVWSGRKAGKSASLVVENGEGKGDLSFCEEGGGKVGTYEGAQWAARGAPNRIRVVH